MNSIFFFADNGNTRATLQIVCNIVAAAMEWARPNFHGSASASDLHMSHQQNIISRPLSLCPVAVNVRWRIFTMKTFCARNFMLTSIALFFSALLSVVSILSMENVCIGSGVLAMYGTFSLVAACRVMFRRVTYFRRLAQTSFKLRKTTNMPSLSPGPPGCAESRRAEVSATIFHKSFSNSFEHFRFPAENHKKNRSLICEIRRS